MVAFGGGIQRELPAGIVEDQIVGLLRGVNPASELAGLNHVEADGGRRVPCSGHGPFHDAQSPRSEAYDGELDHRPRREAITIESQLGTALRAIADRTRNPMLAAVPFSVMRTTPTLRRWRNVRQRLRSDHEVSVGKICASGDMAERSWRHGSADTEGSWETLETLAHLSWAP